MLRFTLRDLLWLTALIGVVLAWRLEQRKTAEMRQARDEAVVLWHDASKKWVEATSLIPKYVRGSGGLGGGSVAPAAAPGAVASGGLGGVLSPAQTKKPASNDAKAAN